MFIQQPTTLNTFNTLWSGLSSRAIRTNKTKLPLLRILNSREATFSKWSNFLNTQCLKQQQKFTSSIDPCYSEFGTLNRNYGITWEFVRNAEHQVVSQNLRFSNIPRNYIEFEKFWLSFKTAHCHPHCFLLPTWPEHLKHGVLGGH